MIFVEILQSEVYNSFIAMQMNVIGGKLYYV